MSDGKQGPGVPASDRAEGSYAAFRAERSERQAARKALRDEARALYSDGDGAAVLRDSFVAYLDSLGTKEAMDILDDEGLRDLLRDSEELAWFLHDEEAETYRQRTLSFSDNVVVGTPVDATYGDGGLFNLVFGVACYQLNRVVRGRFLRGGIARGPLYVDDRHVVGQALVRAVLLEEHEADVPRVLVDEGAMAGVAVELGYYRDPWEAPHNRYLARDGDRVFVNYLAVVEEDTVWRLEAVDEGLVAHRERVAEGLQRHEDNAKVRAKYVWAAKYHDWICSDFFDRPEHRVGYLLKATEQERASSFGLLVPTRLTRTA